MALEHSNCIIYDVTGMDPLGAERLHQIVQEEIRMSGGAAIEMNVPTFNGKRFFPKADKLVEIKNAKPQLSIAGRLRLCLAHLMYKPEIYD